MKIIGLDTNRLTTIIWIFMILSSEVVPQFNIKKTDDELFDLITGEMVPYQVQPDEIIATKMELQKEEDEPQMYKYEFSYVPNEDHYLVKKFKTNPNDVQIDDMVLIVKANEEQKMGKTDETDVSYEESNFLEIIDNLQTNDSLTNLTSLHFSKFLDHKRTLEDFETAYKSHHRVLDIISYEINGGEYITFDSAAMELPEFEEMVTMYLEHLKNKLMTNILSKVNGFIDFLAEGGDPKGYDQMNSFSKFISGNQGDNLKKEVQKYLQDFTTIVDHNRFMMSTIENYYLNDIREYINTDNVATSMMSSIDSQEINLLVETISEYMSDVGYGETPWVISDPDWNNTDDLSKIHMQMKMKDHLSKTVSDFLNNELYKDAEKDDNGNIIKRSIQDKKDDPQNDIEKLEVHLIHMMNTVVKQLESIIDKKWDIEPKHLNSVIELFLEEADFNTFVMDILLDKSKESIQTFIHQYTKTTLERTFVPEIFFGPGVPSIDKDTFSQAMSMFNSKFHGRESDEDTDNFVPFIYQGPEVVSGGGGGGEEDLIVDDVDHDSEVVSNHTEISEPSHHSQSSNKSSKTELPEQSHETRSSKTDLPEKSQKSENTSTKTNNNSVKKDQDDDTSNNSSEVLDLDDTKKDKKKDDSSHNSIQNSNKSDDFSNVSSKDGKQHAKDNQVNNRKKNILID